MRDLAMRAPVALAVAEAATEPVPEGHPTIWSTLAQKHLSWDGLKWSATGHGSAQGHTYVQGTQPAFAPSEKALWVQTGLGPSGNNITIWIKD